MGIKKFELMNMDEPEIKVVLSNADLLLGKPIEPIKRLQVISASDFEDLVREWATGYLKKEYIRVKRCGGAGDMGRDVIAYVNDDDPNNIIWDNYQCKHYATVLSASKAWIELGKLCYYTFKNEYSVPRKYYFVTSNGVSTAFNNLFDKPDELRDKLIEAWDDKCKKKITTGEDIELEGEFLKYVKEFNFSIFSEIDPQALIEQHSQTKYFFYRFGGIQKTRPIATKPPNEIREEEIIYVEKLLEAYGDCCNKKIKNVMELSYFKEHEDHFFRQRKSFYSAESLMRFERDIMPPGSNAFEDLKEEIYDGIIDTVESHFSNGYERVKEVTKVARTLQTPSYPLVNSLKNNDLAGMCHHLVNEQKFGWVVKKDD